jgi:tetratricopeptide (TPR) repeat protein
MIQHDPPRYPQYAEGQVAGNRRAYNTAMQRAAHLAGEKKWSPAIQEYGRALDEFPRDVAALTGLGLAYVETGQLEKALSTYERAASAAPDHPKVVERVGQTLERLARWTDAGRAYIVAAEAHLRLRDIPGAIEMWRKAAVLSPENLEAHRSLARVYENQGEQRRAARHHLIMARVLERQGDHRQAVEHSKTARRLDPSNAEARHMEEALRAGKPLPDGLTARLQPDADGKRTLDSFVIFDDIELETVHLTSDRQSASPADLLREHALAQLADALFSMDSDPDAMELSMLLGQAADLQTRGLDERAIAAYEDALAKGIDWPAIHYNLGLLYQERRDYPRTIAHLERVLGDADYTLGAHYSIGQTYRAWGKYSQALQHLLHVLWSIDAQTVSAERQPALEMIYRQLQEQYRARDGGTETQRLVQSISAFLDHKGWGQRVVEARQQLDSLAGGTLLFSVAETLTEPSSDTALTAMRQIGGYLQEKKIFTALEECFWAIQHAPYYLPLHLRLADILIAEGRLEEAVQKYASVAEAYKIRGNLERAIPIYQKALEIAPVHIGVRERLIQTLQEAGMYDRAIEQYVAVSDTYYQLAQVDKALTTYQQALGIVGLASPDRGWEANILHRMGDIHVQRVDWQRALSTYQRIKRIDPLEYRARAYLVDLYLKLGRSEQALNELDELSATFQDQRVPSGLVEALGHLGSAHPSHLALHIRLAKTYLDLRLKEEAITALDAVGEIQLGTGQTKDAIRTIQAIIRLGPQQVEGYQQLLSQLQAGR